MAILCANSKVEITDNIISNNIGAGIYLLNSSQTFISSNSFVSNDDADIILGQGSKNIAITKNNFTSGILIEVDKIDEFTSFEIDKSNRIFNKTIYYFKNETGLIVPQDAGQIILANCTEIIIENQQISYAHGITLGFSDFNIINNNVLSSNKNAILLINSTFNQIYNNIVRNNHFGILIIRSYNNTLFHNTFIDNTYHTSQGGNNKWDNGYPSGGNYWDDYNGTDEYSGQNQDQPGSDGIGDTPYIVNGQNVDNYPLMEPYNAENPPTPGNETYVWATVITIVAIASVLGIIYWKKRRKRHGLP
jgi:parallel beta-helix repeat protein